VFKTFRLIAYHKDFIFVYCRVRFVLSSFDCEGHLVHGSRTGVQTQSGAADVSVEWAGRHEIDQALYVWPLSHSSTTQSTRGAVH